MRISRLFRKYSRVLLLVFMSLLLVVFLLGDVIGRASRGPRGRDLKLGEVFGEPVYASQARLAADEFALARQLGFTTPDPWIDAESPQERDLVLFLLLKEAEHTGVRIGRDDVVEALRQDPDSARVLEAIRKTTGRSLNSIYDALRRVAAVTWLFRRQMEAVTPVSLPQLERAYRDQHQNARVLISVIDAEALLKQVPEPTEAELQAHFEQAKDRRTAHTDEELVFGYRLEDRVQVEYLTVDPVKMRELVSVREKEAQRYYRDHQNQYVRTVAGQPGEKPQIVPLEYEEIKQRVREDCRAAKAIEEAQRLVNDLEHEARRPWRTVAVDESGLSERPPDEQIVSFAELRARFADRGPIEYHKTGLVTLEELYAEPGFGQAGKSTEQGRILAPALAFRVEGLAEPDPKDRRPILRLYEPGPVVVREEPAATDFAPPVSQAYLFRVTRVAPAGPPAALDDVRPAAVRNLKRLKAFELAGRHARALAEEARRVGLKQAVAAAKELRALLGEVPSASQPATAAAGQSSSAATTQPTGSAATQPIRQNRYIRMLKPFAPRQFLRLPRGGLPNIGVARHLHERVFALAATADSQPGAGHRVVAVPLARQFKWAVVELLGIEPIYRGEFELARERLERQLGWSRQQMFVVGWFKAANVIKRTGFVPAAAGER